MIALGVRPAIAQDGSWDSDTQRYFAETGHWVTGEFLKTYLSVPNPALVFGFPITEAFLEQDSSRIIQYFHRARFEYTPGNPADLNVHISPLGWYLYQKGPELAIPPYLPDCNTFPETGFRLCYTFLDFFEKNGGAAVFGYPISNFEFHDNLIVQYFQHARFEWHPELPVGQRVTLSNLGRMYFDLIGEDPSRILGVLVNNIPKTILQLNTRVFTSKAVLPREGTQTVYIIVQDQYLGPVPDAFVSLVIQMPSGRTERLVLAQQTDQNGIISFPFSYKDETIGLAKIEVEVNYFAIQAKTSTSFRVWW